MRLIKLSTQAFCDVAISKCLWMISLGVTIQMKATEQYVPVVLFITLYKVVLTFESVDEILKCGHSNQTSEQYFLSSFILLMKFLTFEVLKFGKRRKSPGGSIS